MQKMHYCFYCGAELGVYEAKDADSLDTCGKQQCEREARAIAAAEREEAHERLDRDMGWQQ